MTDSIDIVIADDHPLVRTGLRQVIESDAALRIIGEAGDGESALALVRERRPRIAILDLEMPLLNGLQTARRIAGEHLPTVVIILTMFDEEELFNEAMEIGVLGFVLKDSASMDILRAVRTVAAGRYFISPSLANYALRDRREKGSATEQRLGLAQLSPSERRILKLVAQEHTSPQIAEILSISIRTVESHRQNICTKLGLSGVNSLVRFALTHKSDL